MITECLQNLSSGTCVHFVDESQQTNAITTLNTNQSINQLQHQLWVMVIVFNATFNNISVISCTNYGKLYIGFHKVRMDGPTFIVI